MTDQQQAQPPARRRRAGRPKRGQLGELAALRREAWELRATGLSSYEVAERMGVSQASVHRYWHAYRDELIGDDRRDFFDQQLGDLLYLRAQCEPGVQARDLKYIAEARAVRDAIAKLLGLNSPTRVEATLYNATDDDRQLAELIREAQDRNAAYEAEVATAGPTRAIAAEPATSEQPAEVAPLALPALPSAAPTRPRPGSRQRPTISYLPADREG
jgi:hypothetical protein